MFYENIIIVIIISNESEQTIFWNGDRWLENTVVIHILQGSVAVSVAILMLVISFFQLVASQLQNIVYIVVTSINLRISCF
uniref:Uncharacterized protein n=1 Tax=Octopus bimaculoides TaxID=37653 RepID=A0A0L8HL75_OCTBM